MHTSYEPTQKRYEHLFSITLDYQWLHRTANIYERNYEKYRLERNEHRNSACDVYHRFVTVKKRLNYYHLKEQHH